MFKALGAVCTGTCIAQLILLSVFIVRGTLNMETGTKMVALANGIDITGARLQKVLESTQDREQPDFEDILDARKDQGIEMDMRRASLEKSAREQSARQAKLEAEQAAFDERRNAYEQRLEQLLTQAVDEGLQEVMRMIQEMEPAQAKQHLLMMYDDDRVDDVVAILRNMQATKKKDIVAEFLNPAEMEKLDDVMLRIRAGEPMASTIAEAKGS
ncbi:MAG: hypothetical protein AAGA03_01960 [Planctomycetota bacterium]